MKPRMIASDIGGTLTWAAGGIGKFSRCVLNELMKKNIPVSFLTGYNYHSAQKYLNGFHQDAIKIVQNGAVAISHDQILWEHVIWEPDARLIVKEFQKWDVPVYIFRGSHTGFYNEIVSGEPAPLKANFSHTGNVIDFNHILCISIRTGNDLLEKISETFNESLREKYHFILSRGPDISWLEVTHGKTRKDLALERLCKTMDLEVKEVMYFGDNLNDLEILKMVGFPKVVGNAVGELTAMFDTLSFTSEEEAVARYLNELFDLGIVVPGYLLL